MSESSKAQPLKKQWSSPTRTEQLDDIISLQEIQKSFKRFNLTDEQLLILRNNLIGTVNSVLNAYLNDFR